MNLTWATFSSPCSLWPCWSIFLCLEFFFSLFCWVNYSPKPIKNATNFPFPHPPSQCRISLSPRCFAALSSLLPSRAVGSNLRDVLRCVCLRTGCHQIHVFIPNPWHHTWHIRFSRNIWSLGMQKSHFTNGLILTKITSCPVSGWLC